MAESTSETTAAAQWHRLAPPFGSEIRSRRLFADYACQLAELVAQAPQNERAALADELLRRALTKPADLPNEDHAALSAASHVVTDLVRQGWSVRTGGDDVWVAPPTVDNSDPLARKEQIRRQELIRRDEQLAQAPVQEFVRSMERRRIHDGRFVSVLSLMRDGRELANAIRAAQAGTPDAVQQVVDPYLQFVTDEAKCEWTGLRLMDVWRYFRHTWVNQYGSVPGRSMMFLVRDRRAPCHPVMGIGAISSPVVQIRERDLWIGWHPSAFLDHVGKEPSDRIARWMMRVVDAALDEVFTRDFVESGVIKPGAFHKPTGLVIDRLRREGERERKKHHRFAQAHEHKKPNGKDSRDTALWENRARSHLFRSKRAYALAEFLGVRAVLQRHFGSKPTAKKLRALLNDPKGVRAILRVLRKAKADRVGILMADISVCGAVQPYNALLGGKLVAMLATSPELVVAYGQRYATAESEIASSMAGRAIVRDPHLVFLSTTSLYGASSQYNRISIPSERLGQRPGEELRYVESGTSDAYGTSQFSEATVDALTRCVQQSETGQRVNSIFGEGQSPKLRKIREGLDTLEFPSSALLQHGRRRVVYCIPLIRNTRDYLLGIDAKPDYLVPPKDVEQASRAIAQWWKERWFIRRTQSTEVLSAVEKHTLVYPIRHGARVVLPSANPDQLPLFQPDASSR